jgi:hypothetical protein
MNNRGYRTRTRTVKCKSSRHSEHRCSSDGCSLGDLVVSLIHGLIDELNGARVGI